MGRVGWLYLLSAAVVAAWLAANPPSKITVQTKYILPVFDSVMEQAGFAFKHSLHGLDPVTDPKAFAVAAAKVSDTMSTMIRLINRRLEADPGVRLSPLHSKGSLHPDVAIVVFNATRPADVPSRAVVYIHGGGFALGNASMVAPFAGYLQRTLDATVISIDYRLAPLHPFPAAVEDSAAALAWIVDNAAALNIFPHSIAITGDSAGGNLALTSMLWLKQFQPSVFKAVSHIAPVYPTTDGSCLACYASSHLFGKGHFLETADMHMFIAAYVQSSRAAAETPLVSPILAPITDLAAFPPTFISTADHDVLRDEGRAMAKRMQEAGVRVLHKEYPQTLHGFMSVPAVEPQARELWQDMAAFIRVPAS